MSNNVVQMPESHIESWRARLASYRSVCALMRDLAKEYGAQRNDVGAMLYALFDNFSQDELMYVWKWDFEESGIGLPDDRIDKSLEHLLWSPLRDGSGR